VLSQIAAATLLVVAYGETSKRGLARSLELLGQVDAPVVGTVLNLVPVDQSYGGNNYRYYAYHGRSERRRQRRTRSTVSGPTLHPRAIGADGDAGVEPVTEPAGDRLGREQFGRGEIVDEAR